jgi:kynurenine formamidase
MHLFLSHPLDPNDLAWPGEPVLEVRQCTRVGVDSVFDSFISTLPNHFGTHMDAPRHFVPGRVSINELPIKYFCHDRVLLIDIPKEKTEGVMPEDLKPYEDEIKKVSFLIIRTGFEKYRSSAPEVYQKEGPHLHPETGKYLVSTFPDLYCIGFDFLAVGSPSNDMPPDAHQQLLGYHTEKFVTAIEDMHLSEIGDRKIKRLYNAPLRIAGVDSSQVTVIAEV